MRNIYQSQSNKLLRFIVASFPAKISNKLPKIEQEILQLCLEILHIMGNQLPSGLSWNNSFVWEQAFHHVLGLGFPLWSSIRTPQKWMGFKVGVPPAGFSNANVHFPWVICSFALGDKRFNGVFMKRIETVPVLSLSPLRRTINIS